MFNLFRNWYRRNFSAPGTVEFALVLLAVFIIVYYFMWLFGQLIVALCLAYVLDWSVMWMKKRFNLGRKCASTIVMTIFIGFCVGVLLFVAPKVVKQGTDFYDALVLYSQDSLQQSQQLESSATDEVTGVDAVNSREPSHMAADGISLSGSALDTAVARKIYSFVDTMPDPLPSMLSLERIESFSHNIRTSLMTNTAQILKDNVMPSVVNAMSWAINLVIVPILMFLMLLNKRVLQERMLKYVLPSDSALIHKFWPKLNEQLHSYVNGSLMHIVISGVANCIVFWFFGLHYAVLLGIAMGFSVVIPYVGAVLVGVPVLLFAAIQFGFTSFFVYFVIAWLVLQLVDSYVLTPLLFSKTMDLDAFTILCAILIFGTLWGFWGVVFSIPLARFIETIISQWPSVNDAEQREPPASLPKLK